MKLGLVEQQQSEISCYSSSELLVLMSAFLAVLGASFDRRWLRFCAQVVVVDCQKHLTTTSNRGSRWFSAEQASIN
jgi:hypothetical protein